MELNRYTGLLISVITTICFNRSSRFLEESRLTQPESTLNNEYLSWKWRNFLISFFHSTIAGLATLFCVIEQPLLISDMINTPSGSAYLLACFSHGYFCYDLLEMILKFKFKGSGELICHHLLVVSCLAISIWYRMYLGYAVIALIVEINNIFLHMRQLLNIAKVPKTSRLYRINCWINLGTFIVFRIMTLLWLGMCLVEHYAVVPVLVHSTATLCLGVVAVMTGVLLYRLIISDFFPPANDSSLNSKTAGTHDNSKPISGGPKSGLSSGLRGSGVWSSGSPNRRPSKSSSPVSDYLKSFLPLQIKSSKSSAE